MSARKSPALVAAENRADKCNEARAALEGEFDLVKREIATLKTAFEQAIKHHAEAREHAQKIDQLYAAQKSRSENLAASNNWLSADNDRLKETVIETAQDLARERRNSLQFRRDIADDDARRDAERKQHAPVSRASAPGPFTMDDIAEGIRLDREART